VTIDAAIEQVQFAYPQIYYACHTRHGRRRSNGFRLSDRDSALLVHVGPGGETTVSSLAAHLGLSRSTVSEALSRLDRLGYVRKTTGAGEDRRRVAVSLTPAGVSAVRATSALEPRRLRAVLQRMSPKDRVRAIDGLARFARACRSGAVSAREEETR
jgi:DNA-binding MarR family transcriptional regulator